MFPKNTWYVACTSDEISNKPLARKICDESIVFFRDHDGSIAALEDFCPHRGVPLSLGFVDDGQLVCGYHGLRMGRDGRTHSMPKQKVQHFPCIRVFPIVERYGFIWIWVGKPELSDPSLIPEFIWGNNPQWAFGGGLFHINCDYRLMIDNLMDLTHETYVHASSIGQKEIDEAPVKTRVDNGKILTSRFIENISAPPFWKMALESNELDPNASVDRWQICHFIPPSHVMIEVGVALAGYGSYEADHKYKVSSTVIDFITPETKSSIWYFWGMARRFKPEDVALTEKIREGQGKIFAEDRKILEQQQINLDRHAKRKLLMLDIDSGGVQARRMLSKMIKEEQAQL